MKGSNRFGVLPLLLPLLAGCVAPQLAPADLARSGWRIQETAAVWRPQRAAPELIGELLVAAHPDGSRFVQFSKQTLPLVTAQSATNGWRLSSSLRRSVYGGGPPPTDRVPWFQLDRLPPVSPSSERWQLTTNADASWQLLNPRTGETLESAASGAVRL